MIKWKVWILVKTKEEEEEKRNYIRTIYFKTELVIKDFFGFDENGILLKIQK